MRMDIAGAIRNRAFRGYTDDAGNPVDPKIVEQELRAMLARGVKFMVMGGPCPDFSQETGCPGHELETTKEERQ